MLSVALWQSKHIGGKIVEDHLAAGRREKFMMISMTRREKDWPRINAHDTGASLGTKLSRRYRSTWKSRL